MRRSNAICWAGAAGAALVLGMAGPAAAQSRWALGAQGGSPGIGASVEFMATPHFTIRGEYDHLDFEGDVQGQVLTYKGHFKLDTGGLFVDWHPWANAWLFSAGAFIGAREAGGDPELQAVNPIGGQTFTLEQARGIKTKIVLDDFAPTLAVGWNNTFLHSHWGFKVLAGVVFSSKPAVTLSRVGATQLPADVEARLQAALRAEQQNIADHTDILQTYPLIQLGVNYRF